jgi:phosphoribosylformylglycinamidine cyclo-ligase
MGHRMEIYLDEQYAEQIISISKSFNIDAQIIGRVESSDHKQVTVKSSFGEFSYQ